MLFQAEKESTEPLTLPVVSFESSIPSLTDKSSVALWFWLGHESGASERMGTLINAFGASLNAHQFADHTVKLELANAASKERGLLDPSQSGAENPGLAGPAPCFADDWHFAVLVRDGDQVRVRLFDGNEKPILTGKAGENNAKLIFGKGLQGRLDEITIWDCAIESKLIAQLWKTSKVRRQRAPRRRASGAGQACLSPDHGLAQAARELVRLHALPQYQEEQRQPRHGLPHLARTEGRSSSSGRSPRDQRQFNYYAVLTYYLAGAYGLLFGPVAGIKAVLVLAAYVGGRWASTYSAATGSGAPAS